MSDTARSLVVRALNYWRQYHLETYVGLRYLSARTAVNDESSWLMDFIARKAITKRGDRHLIFPRFKRLDAGGRFEYRVRRPRPVEAIIEIQALLQLRNIKGFENRPNVYSYRWPSGPTEKRIYEYYWLGYSQRNRDIANASLGLANPVVLIADVKSFYPSIDRDLLERQLQRALPQGNSEENVFLRNHLQTSIKLGPGQQVLPVGPPTSHVLANLVMSDIDNSLSAKHGCRYFRYVDDIAIVCEKEEATQSLRNLESLLGNIGLKLNGEKTDEVSGAAWANRFKSDQSKNASSFDGMVTRATLACALFPDRLPEFRQVCRDQNILFPDRRLMHHSRSNRYRRWLYVLLKNGAQSLKAATQLNAEVFAAQLVKIRRDLETLADRLFEAPSASSPLTRRWQIQDQRFVLNRLFYLTPLDEFGKLLRHVPPEPEHLELGRLPHAWWKRQSLHQFQRPAVVNICSVAERRQRFNLGVLRQPSAANMVFKSLP